MPFRDPIVAGDTLVRDAIESEGFLTGVTGWSIGRDGDAEFNDATFRGTIEAVGSGQNRIRIIVQSGIPTIEFRNADGELTYVDVTNDQFRIFPATAGNSRFIIVRDEGGKHGIIFRAATDGRSVLFDDDDGFLKAGVYSPWTEETWTEITYQNGWGRRADAGFFVPSARINALGHVELSGAVFKVGGGNNGTSIGNLPAKYRPAAHVFLPLPTNNGNAYAINILTNGNMNLLHSQGASPTFNTVILGGSYPLAAVDPAIT